MSGNRHIGHSIRRGPSWPGRLSCVGADPFRFVRWGVAKYFTDETAEFVMPRLGRHAAPDTGEVDVTQRFDPGFRQQRPVTSAPLQLRDDDGR